MLRDENEQLRTSLEAALEETDALAEDRDRLLRRVADLSRELALARMARQRAIANETGIVRQSQTEEELRVAFEELQVLTEELEVANTDLHQTNQELDARVEERTRANTAVNTALRATEASFRTVAISFPIYFGAPTARRRDWFNQRWFDIPGRAPRIRWDVAGSTPFHSDDRDAVAAEWMRRSRGGTPITASTASAMRSAHIAGFSPGPSRSATIAADHALVRRGHRHSRSAGGDGSTPAERIRFRTLVEGMPQLAWRAADGGQWTWSSPQWSAIRGRRRTRAAAWAGSR